MATHCSPALLRPMRPISAASTNMPKSKRAKLTGRGAVGKAIVVGTRERDTNRIAARSVEGTDGVTLKGFVAEHTAPGAKVFTNEGYQGTFHHFSEKHLDRYVSEFAGRHNIREQDTADQMAVVAADMVGKRLRYQDLIRSAAIMASPAVLACEDNVRFMARLPDATFKLIVTSPP